MHICIKHPNKITAESLHSSCHHLCKHSAWEAQTNKQTDKQTDKTFWPTDRKSQKVKTQNLTIISGRAGSVGSHRRPAVVCITGHWYGFVMQHWNNTVPTVTQLDSDIITVTPTTGAWGLWLTSCWMLTHVRECCKVQWVCVCRPENSAIQKSSVVIMKKKKKFSVYHWWSIFTGMPKESYCRQLRSLLLYLCHIGWVLINSLVHFYYYYYYAQWMLQPDWFQYGWIVGLLMQWAWNYHKHDTTWGMSRILSNIVGGTRPWYNSNTAVNMTIISFCTIQLLFRCCFVPWKGDLPWKSACCFVIIYSILFNPLSVWI